MRNTATALAAVLLMTAAPAWAAPKPHNVIVYVADGLRSHIVTPQNAPAMAALRAEGVDFRESHSMMPTITTPNASAIATGHGIGDTGDFGNSIFAGLPALPGVTPSTMVPGLENDVVLGAMNDRFESDYLGHDSLLALARKAGYSTAAIGKLGPTSIQDVTQRDGKTTIVIDDSTGTPVGIPLSPEIAKAIATAGLADKPPSRAGNNGFTGNATTPGTLNNNALQQDWLVGVATKVVLPRFRQANKPFAMVFWSRDPDGSQHNQGDSLNKAEPGINGPTSMAGIRNADNDLARLRATLKELGLDKTTDIVVTSDHAFSTVWKQSETSPSKSFSYLDVPAGFLPPGFLAIDLAQGLALPLYKPTGEAISIGEGGHPVNGSALLGADPKNPQIVIGANGGADMIWLPTDRAKEWAAKIAKVLIAQDYVASIFVDDSVGPIAGALPLSAIGQVGDARTPRPAMVVSFRSIAGTCGDPEICSLDISDTELQQGQGTHGSFSRTDTHNFMAATGPSFKKRFVDETPVSNADWTPTLAKALGLTLPAGGALPGRVMSEALVGGKPVTAEVHTTRSDPAANGFNTILNWRSVGTHRYYDAAGMPGRVVGLKP